MGPRVATLGVVSAVGYRGFGAGRVTTKLRYERERMGELGRVRSRFWSARVSTRTDIKFRHPSQHKLL